MFRRTGFIALLALLMAGHALDAQRGAGEGQGREGGQARRGRQGGAQAAPSNPEVPIVGLAGVAFRTSDLTKARAYYTGVLGFPEAFSLKSPSGVMSVYFKVNDDQYVEVVNDIKPGELRRQARVMFQSNDLKKLHAIYTERGLNPTPIADGPDGNPVFRVIGPSGAKLDFIEYVPTSRQGQLRGKLLDPRRISTQIWHVGIYTEDRAASAPFYGEKLGLPRGRDVGRGEYIETPSSDRNTETKYPPLDPNIPAQKAQFERESMGAVEHMALEVADMRAATRSRPGARQVHRPPGADARGQQPALADAHLRSGRFPRRAHGDGRTAGLHPLDDSDGPREDGGSTHPAEDPWPDSLAVGRLSASSRNNLG